MCAFKRSWVVILPVLVLLPAAQAAAQAAQSPADTAVGSAPAVSAPATVPGATVPSDAVWFVSVHVKRFADHPLGQQILKMLEEAIREEAGDVGGKLDLETARAKIGKVIGFDLLDGIGSITLYGSASPFEGKIRSEDELVEKMAATTVAVVTLSGGSGNLEGLALATPDYQSAEYKGATIHSGTLPDTPARVYMAVLKEQGADKPSSVVLGLDEDQVKQALDRLNGRPPQSVPVAAAKGTFLTAGMKLDEATIRALGIPQQQSAVFKMLTRVSVSLGAEKDLVTAQLAADMINEQRAEQVRQLVQGAVALGELLLELPIEDFPEEELMMLREFLKDVDVKVARDGAQVTCRFTKPAETLLKDLTRAWTGQRESARRQAIERQRAALERARAVRRRAEAEAAKRRERQTDVPRGESDEEAPDGRSGRR